MKYEPHKREEEEDDDNETYIASPIITSYSNFSPKLTAAKSQAVN
jgi:hypothetical protein